MRNARDSVAGERFYISQIFSGEATLDLLNSPPSFALESIFLQPTRHVRKTKVKNNAQLNFFFLISTEATKSWALG